MDVTLYNTIANVVVKSLKSYSYQDNVFRDAYLDDKSDEVVREPRDLDSFASDLSSNPPKPTPNTIATSNLISTIENFIPTAQETSEYSGKTTNWLENSILLMLPFYPIDSSGNDLPEANYTSFMNRNVKVFIVLNTKLLKSGDLKDLTMSLRVFSKLAARTNGHFILSGSYDYQDVISQIMDFGYGKDLVFSRSIKNANSREIGTLKVPKSRLNRITLLITITEGITSEFPEMPLKLSLTFKASGINDVVVYFLKGVDEYTKDSNFYSKTVDLTPGVTYTVTTFYASFYNSTDLFIRIWTDRVYYQYAEFVDLNFNPSNPNDKEGAAMRMTVLNNCWQQERAEISITDCSGLETKKYDVEQVSGIPIGTEGSYPKFAFVPYFCDAFGSGDCINGTEDKYDVQLSVGDYSITRSFQCLSGSETIDPNCTEKDANGNVYCTRNSLPYKRGPTGQLTDCLGRGHLEFDSIEAEDYVCICDNGFSGVSYFEYDDFCNVGEKHSTFLFAYATDFDVSTFSSMVTNYVIPAITNDRHNYTKLARVRFDTVVPEDISYHDDVADFQTMLNNNPPVPGLAADPANPSNFLSVISSFLNATGRPLESSMIILLVNRFPQIGVDLTQAEYDKITNNNVKIFPIISYSAYDQQNPIASRTFNTFSGLAANSNGHFVVGNSGSSLENVMQVIMGSAYTNSLAWSRNLGSAAKFYQETLLGTMKVPRNRLGSVNYTVTVAFETLNREALNVGEITLTFYQQGQGFKSVDFDTSVARNFYTGNITLKPNMDCDVSILTTQQAGNLAVRVWTPSTTYHYGSYAAIDDPMGGNPLTFVEEYQGAALRMRIMNDCYTDYSGSITITDCNGQVSKKYDSIQNIPTDYIFADEGSFPHYPFVPFFCDSTPQNPDQCVNGTQSKYDIQFVAGEFTVTRSFQCRVGVGKVDPKCRNVDANGNYYCDRDQVPYMRGPTGQLVDCLGHGHVEFDFNDTETYICVCDEGYSGVSCEQKA